MNARAVPVMLAALLLAACGDDSPEVMVGTVERDRIELAAEFSEPVTEVAVRDGEAVQVGQLLLRQDPARFEAVLARQQALRDQSAARLAELRRGPREEAIREAQARLAAAEVRQRNAVTDLERAREIFERGLSNQSTVDDAETRARTTSADTDAAREALAALLNGTTVEELQQAEAALRAAEAAVAQAQVDLDRLDTLAPVAGRLDQVLAEPGERPVPGETLAVLLDGARLYARLYVPEPMRAEVRPGTRLQVSVDGRDAPLPATVRWVSDDASFTPYFALTEHDRSRLAYLAEADFDAGTNLPAGLPLEAVVTGAQRDPP